MSLSRSALAALNTFALGLALLLVWPVAQMVVCAFTTDIDFPPRHWGLGGFRSVVWPSFLIAIRFSLLLGVATTVLLLAIGLPAAYAIERRRFRGRRLLSVLIFVPTIFPGVTYVSAIGIYVAIFFPGLRGHFPVLLLGTAMVAVPLVVRALQASLATVDPVFEEAAQVMGASPVVAFVRVTLPMIGPGVITAAMISFTAAALSFVPAFILGSGQPTVSLFIYRDIAKFGFTPGVAAMVLVTQAVMVGLVGVLTFVFRRQFRGVFV